MNMKRGEAFRSADIQRGRCETLERKLNEVRQENNRLRVELRKFEQLHAALATARVALEAQQTTIVATTRERDALRDRVAAMRQETLLAARAQQSQGFWSQLMERSCR